MFFAALGNHDDRNQRYYKQFNMEGQRYYSFKGAAAERAVLRDREHRSGAHADRVD